MIIRLIALCLATLVTAFGVPMDCVSGSLADYISLPEEGCRIGQTVFSQFLDPGPLPGSEPIDPASVLIDPVMDPISLGLLFTYNATAGPGMVRQSVVEFFISSPAEFQYATLQMTGNDVDIGSVVVVTSEICDFIFLGGCEGTPEVLGVFDDGINTAAADIRSLSARRIFAVRHDMVLDATFGTSAAIGSAELRFAVPEPATGAVVFAALTAAFVVRLRRRSPRPNS
jgi:hypothetical protein